MSKCDMEKCEESPSRVSRLSPEGFLISSGNKAYSFREAYKRFNYCEKCHSRLMKDVWSRVRDHEYKGDDHVAPTAI